MEGEVVYAIHNFEASVEDEISLVAGEAILVIEKDELYNDGWWQGGIRGGDFISTVNPQPSNNLPGRYANLLGEGKWVGPSIADGVGAQDKNQTQAEGEPSQASITLGGRLSDPLMPPVSYPDGTDSDATSSTEGSETASDTKGESVLKEGYSTLTPAFSSSDPGSGLPQHNANHNDSIKERRTPSTPNRSSFRNSVRLSADGSAKLPHPTLWTKVQVVEWLRQVGFESVAGLFLEHEITGDILVKLDLNSLKDIGVLAFGKRFNLNNAINALKSKFDLQSPIKKDRDSSSDDPPPPSTEAKPPVGHELYPLETRQGGQLTQKVQALALTESASPHEHVQQWLQAASEYDFDHDPLKVFHTDVHPNLDFKNGMGSSTEARSYTSAGTNLEAGYDPSQPVAFKKQVSFSKNLPEVIGISEAEFDERDVMQMRANQKALPPPPMPASRMDPFSVGDNPVTRTFSVDPVSVEDIMAATYPPVSGYLKKQEGAIKLWKLRWCELEGSSFRVWESPKRKKLKLNLDLRGYKPVLDPSLNPGKYCFKLVHPFHKAHGFSSDEPNDIRAWMKALMKVSIDRDVSAPVVTSCTVNTVPLHVARKLAPRPPSTMIGSRDTTVAFYRPNPTVPDSTLPHRVLKLPAHYNY
ncbi:hypothetical protein L0F63_001214 [Massospora cicadina]|nr:hypothetical protein L0F63_001214 [Massospora cicadina]